LVHDKQPNKGAENMTTVNVQFFTTLDGELTRENFSAAGGSQWTTDPPLTINSGTPSQGVATLENGSTVDATYYYNRNGADVTFFVTVTVTNGAVTARASANQEGFQASANVTGTAPNCTVGVNFR
jgi:hypothetical protein